LRVDGPSRLTGLIQEERFITLSARTGGEPVRGRDPLAAAQAISPAPLSSSHQCLLDLDGDLADELEPEVRRAARAAATVITLDIGLGRVAMGHWLTATSQGLGVMLLDGVLATDVQVGDRTAAEIVGAGDLIQRPCRHHHELLSCQVQWRALVPVRLALLDQAFTKRVRFWPQIAQALLRRAGSRIYDLNVQRAIAVQPRLEVRLCLLLWHLAARWGKVEPGGVRLSLPLTHQLLGRLVGAERPSVSHALARLSRAGIVDGHGEEWHLRGSVQDWVITPGG
jgi:CRP/FNR family transcriptional regulator, cyclic AMP receptor protein